MKLPKDLLVTVGRGTLILNALIALYTAGFGLFSAMDQRGIHWLLLSVSLFLLYKPKEGLNIIYKKIFYSMNLIFILGALISGVYLLMFWEDRTLRLGVSSVWDFVMAIVMIVIVLEATRRKTGNALTMVTLFFLAYAIYGPYFPGITAHSGVTLERLSNFLYFTTEGIFGIPLGISATFIIVFVLFGSFLEKFGGGQWFIDISYALTGRFRGGPAKTAVVSSGLMGMLSGSPVANVATTGTFTIPLMKKVGFNGRQAGAIEAVASTGGMITPPIMGAGAFIMAEYLGVPYMEIAAVAIIPAFLFYVALLLNVDSLAVKQGIVGMEKSQLPKVKDVMKTRGHLALPLLFLIIMILIGWSPMKAAFWSIIVSIIIAFYKTITKPTLKSILQALENGSNEVISIAAACASAGIIVGVISISGIGAKISFALVDLSQGNVLLALLLTMLITIVLGFGMPPTAVYIILVAIVVPPLVDLGVTPIGAHMFLFFFSTIAALTPPVAITAYAAAAIAKSDPNKTGITAFRLGILAYIIPFIFVFSPSLLLQGSTASIVIAIFTAILGVCCLVAGIEGYLLMRWKAIPRVFLVVTSLLLLDDGWKTDMFAIAGVILAILIQKVSTTSWSSGSSMLLKKYKHSD
ncbi:TRAP transporter permease [Paenisporosarcina antarctica]|uniref:TRAP transporter fused permease subunit n=1 Tax=Paenisporosarcina antarctica TaxID=417367 RepID=A0A4P7A3U4_9BACL|nr:TRAP transporter fused permease subunit [Paenisporosarcina antarctica]QBP43189.1 TRAP transporter fused permease subunit [Paenisporosarcina antarctica]